MKDLSVPVPKKSGIKNGQSLVEALAAVAVAAIIVTGLLSAVIVTVKNAQFAKNQALATKYANEGMENTRQQRDANWETFWSQSGNEVITPITGTIFSGEIKYEDVSEGANNKMKVTVTVSWTDSSGTHNSQLVSYFTKQTMWR